MTWVCRGGAYVFTSANLELEVHPAEGGRVSSLQSLPNCVEFLMQPQRPATHGNAAMDARFQDGYASGIEECLPTVAASDVSTRGGAAPDHGDFWQLAWTAALQEDGTLQMSAEGFSRPLRFSKSLRVEARSLAMHYVVTNIGDAATDFLYACHPLFAIDAGDVVMLPDEIRTMIHDFSRRGRFGAPGDTVSWPRPKSDSEVDLSRTLAYEAREAEMLYSFRLGTGWAGLYRTAAQQGIVVRFDPNALPFLGVWLCYGAWPEDDAGRYQYAVALEPGTAPTGSLKRAQETSTESTIRPGETAAWDICFVLSEPGISLDEFRAFCEHG